MLHSETLLAFPLEAMSRTTGAGTVPSASSTPTAPAWAGPNSSVVHVSRFAPIVPPLSGCCPARTAPRYTVAPPTMPHPSSAAGIGDDLHVHSVAPVLVGVAGPADGDL
jgi:hypothetical protein